MLGSTFPGSLGDRLRVAPPETRPWLVAAVALGVAGDVLLRAAPGWNLALWLAGVLAAGVMLAPDRGAPGRRRLVVAGLGVLAAATLAVRSAPPLQVLAIGLVGVSAGWLLLERPWTNGVASRLAALVGAGLSAIAAAPVAAIAPPRSPERDAASWARRSAVVARGAVVAAPILFVLGALFVGGDPVFARHADRLLETGLDRVASHLAFALVLAWIAGGLAYAVAGVRVGELAPAPGTLGRWAGEAIVALVLIDVLFAVFLGVQVSVLFGGRELVEATSGMTYAEYARSGFFQLAVAGAIALPTILLVDWVTGPESRYRGAFLGLAYGLAAGVVLVLASAAHRMAVYVEAYGLTEARFYASAFMAWLAVAAVWLAVTLARGRTERFAPGSLVAGWALFVALVVANPAAIVVRVNADRAAAGEGPGFDVQYGVGALGVDAVPALAGALDRLPPEERCRVAARLVAWRASSVDEDRRSWTLSRWRAGRVFEEREAAIRAVAGPCLDQAGEPAIEAVLASSSTTGRDYKESLQ